MSKRVAGLLAAPVLGFLAMVIPVLAHRPGRWHTAPLFPLICNAVEHVGWRQLVLLLVAGLVLGLLSSLGAFRLGLVAVVFLPAAAVAEMVADPTSHNLWPLEFVIYGFYGCVVAAGVAAVHGLQKRRRPAVEGAADGA